MSTSGESSSKTEEKKTFLTYVLSPRQDAVINYLIPSICSCTLYMFIIAADIAVIYRHYKDEDPIWASVTQSLIWLPLLGSYIVIISDWDLWPEKQGWSIANIKWAIIKTVEHIFFPVWQMWRYGEKIFWSIEAIRTDDENSRSEALAFVYAARNIELYAFLQAYLHSLPQIMLQFYILMRHENNINKETKDAQLISIVLNLVKVSVTTTYFQRFKTQKLAGKEYPWFKVYKKVAIDEPDAQPDVVLRHRRGPSRSVIEDAKRESSDLEGKYNIEPARLSQRRRSSDIYLEPTTSQSDEHSSKRTTAVYSDISSMINQLFRDTADGSKKMFLRGTGFSDRSQPNFDIKRVKEVQVKGLPEDDMAGKLVATLWWFSFLLARVLAISVFAYLFVKQTIYLLVAHFLVIMAFLLYDVRSDQLNRGKAVFFLFIGLIYIFCIIEFKIKFKKAKIIYYGYFGLVYLENIVMCVTWYNEKADSIENSFWFRYSFYLVILCSINSGVAMLFYFFVNKPEKIVVETHTEVVS